MYLLCVSKSPVTPPAMLYILYVCVSWLTPSVSLTLMACPGVTSVMRAISVPSRSTTQQSRLASVLPLMVLEGALKVMVAESAPRSPGVTRKFSGLPGAVAGVIVTDKSST